MRGGPQLQAGFTLIELMVVVILIGILSGIMVGEMRGTYEDALLRATARQLVNAANLAASRAVAQNQTQALVIEPEAKRLRVVAKGGGETVDEETLDERIRIDIRNTTTTSDEDVDETPQDRRPLQNLQRIEFWPDGTADAREIALHDRMGVELVLKLNPVTGRIRIAEGEVPP